MRKLAVTIDGQTFRIETDAPGAPQDERRFLIEGKPVCVQVPRFGTPPEGIEWLIVDGKPYEIVFDHALHWIQSQGHSFRVEIRDLDEPGARPSSTDGRIKAPIPGQINKVMVEPGQRVNAGDTLLVLEAMKMENHITAPMTGVVRSVHVLEGESVTLNKVMAEIAPGESD